MNEKQIIRLAEMYLRGIQEAAIVAEICDTILDRSGALLGKVREVALELRSERVNE